jgi:hypothetical protein
MAVDKENIKLMQAIRNNRKEQKTDADLDRIIKKGTSRFKGH